MSRPVPPVLPLRGEVNGPDGLASCFSCHARMQVAGHGVDVEVGVFE